MRLRRLTIRNFRNLVDVSIPVTDTTVLVGENNAGKTALLSAVQVALPRSAYGRLSPFDDYDYHMGGPEDTPQSSIGVTIEMWFHENASGEWPDTLKQALHDIIQLDPYKDINYIILRTTSRYDGTSGEMALVREFLNVKGEPLTGKAQSQTMLNRFLEYVRIYYLSPLRDCEAEFAPRSQFWGRILRDLKINDQQRQEIADNLRQLNTSLFASDSRMEQVRTSLETIHKVIRDGGITSIQPLPIKPWDLLAKSEVVIQSSGNSVDFPLRRHGQGIQSLAVLFLFQAFVDVLLKPTFHPDTEALLALEEPEAHLHPQAVRALTARLKNIAAQKIISTHSPYVLQTVATKDIRLFRRDGAGAVVRYVPRSFSVPLPPSPALSTFCANSPDEFQYDETFQELVAMRAVSEEERRKLLRMYATDPTLHSKITAFQRSTRFYLSDDDLTDLDTFAKRIRGEIFFARAWLLCEGQSEFLLLQFFAELLGTPLDEYGVSVIDFKNNGSEGAFIKLAENLGIPWLLLCDDDPAGQSYVKTVTDLGFATTAPPFHARPVPLTNGDLERFLIENGFLIEYEQLIQKMGISLTLGPMDPEYKAEVAEAIRNAKTEMTHELIRLLRSSGADAARIPAYFANAIQDIIKRAG